MRAFIAIELPIEVKEELRKAQALLKEAKLSFAKDFHITLMFLGELTPDKVEHVKKQLSLVKFKQYTVRINSIGIFRNKKQIRTVWASIEPEKETLALEQEISKLLPEYKEKREFSAHITIARVKYVKDNEEFINAINNIKLNKLKFNIREFKLKKSTLTPQGPLYEDLGVYQGLT